MWLTMWYIVEHFFFWLENVLKINPVLWELHDCKYRKRKENKYFVFHQNGFSFKNLIEIISLNLKSFWCWSIPFEDSFSICFILKSDLIGSIYRLMKLIVTFQHRHAFDKLEEVKRQNQERKEKKDRKRAKKDAPRIDSNNQLSCFE